MNESLKSLIFFFVRSKYPSFVNGGEIERYALSVGFKASNASRRCRELYREGYIERRINKRTVEYLYKPKDQAKVVKNEEEESRQRLIWATG